MGIHVSMEVISLLLMQIIHSLMEIFMKSSNIARGNFCICVTTFWGRRFNDPFQPTKIFFLETKMGTPGKK